MLFHLHHFMDEGLDDSDAHLVVARLVLMVDRDQIEVDADEDALDIKLVDQLLEYLAQLEQALDDEAR